MALPLESTLRPGGIGVMNSLRNINELTKSNIENKYLPVTSLAEAASKIAYANLVGPQFLAKLMGNPDILANIKNPNQITNTLVGAGSGGGAATNLFNQLSGGDNQSLASYVVNKLKEIWGKGSNNTAQASSNDAQVSSNAMNARSEQQSSASATDSQNSMASQPASSNAMQSPAQQSTAQPFPDDSTNYAKQSGKYKGIVKEGEEEGDLRAKDIKDLNDIAYNGYSRDKTFSSLADLVGSASFRNIRQTPFAGRHELGWYAQNGTPEQQKAVGQFYALTGNIIKDSAKDFQGQFRVGEQALLEQMKPTEKDMPDVAMGKLEALAYMNRMVSDRAAATAQIMKQQNLNKGEAIELADKQINGEKMRQLVHDKLNPTITVKNKKTGEIVTLPIAEARKRGIPNV